MFSWLGDIISGMGDAIGNVFESISDSVVDSVLNRILQWLFTVIYNGIADLFTSISNMGIEIFSLNWVNAVVKLFSVFGWSLFVSGLVVSAFDLAIETESGGGSIKGTALNWIKGFLSVNLFTVVPIQLYKFCVSLQNIFAKNLTNVFSSEQYVSFGDLALKVLQTAFNPQGTMVSVGLLEFLSLIALGFCVVKIFFDNIKRGGILLIQIAVGSLYMFSIPRGYNDGFIQWTKQVIAICLTAFMQITLLFLGLLTWSQNMLLGIGIMMAAAEVPRIAGQSGLQKGNYINYVIVE